MPDDLIGKSERAAVSMTFLLLIPTSARFFALVEARLARLSAVYRPFLCCAALRLDCSSERGIEWVRGEEKIREVEREMEIHFAPGKALLCVIFFVDGQTRRETFQTLFRGSFKNAANYSRLNVKG